MAIFQGTSEDDFLIAGIDFAGFQDEVYGLEGNDEIDAGLGSGGNLLVGGPGNDVIYVGSNDEAQGGSGNDTLDASDEGGNNRLQGDEGNDILFAGVNDELDGGADDDIFYPGTGGNRLTGGIGRDFFYLAIAEAPTIPNTITDFSPNNDQLAVNLTEISQQSDLTQTQQGQDTVVSLTATGQVLAVLEGVTANTFSILINGSDGGDLNQPPVITSSPTFSVVENTISVGTVTATATDADGDALVFSIGGGADQSLFAIDGNSGALTFLVAPDFENPADDGGDNVYDVQVQVSDSFNITSQDITVTVTDVSNDISVAPESDGTFTVALPDGTKVTLKYLGEPFIQGTFGNWRVLEAKTINGQNQVLWENPDTDEIGIWNADAVWNWISSDVFATKSLDTLTAETDFQVDVNGDGLLGDNLVSKEAFGSVELLQGVFDYYHIQTADGLTNPIKYQNQPFENNFGNWRALGAETVEGINQVLWENLDNGDIGVWNTDSNWNWLTSNVFAAGSPEAASQLSLFGLG